LCDICQHIHCLPLCPNYTPPKASCYCSICGNGIFGGEDYIKNIDDEYAHYDCLFNLPCRAMIEWMGGEIRTMEDDYD